MKRVTRPTISILFFLLLFQIGYSQERPSGQNVYDYVATLCADDMEGRDTGTPGYEKAVRWVAAQYEEWGLKPVIEEGYIQEFPFSFYKYQFQYPKLSIDKKVFYSQDNDFSILRYSGGGRVKGEVVFVGYGINAPDLGLDEYADVDVKGKIVLVMHGCPADDVDKWEDHHSPSAKVTAALQNGAAGLMLCANFREEELRIGRWRLRPSNYQEKFVAYGVDERVVRSILSEEGEWSRSFINRMRTLQRSLDKELKPISKATGKKATLQAKVEYDPVRIGKNVVGMIKGTDPVVGDEVLVIGAHLDHLGIRYGKIYNGADDNATGSAVVMELARFMMANDIKPKRTIIFACWGGEERGLLGSRYYAANSPFPIEKTVMNFNLDMVGLGENLAYRGQYYAPEHWDFIQPKLTEEQLELIQPGRGGPGGSDHTPFVVRGIPSFSMITTPWGSHPDYHQPDDDIEKISIPMLEKVTNFVYDQLLLFANADMDLNVEDRHARYLYKSAILTNINPIPYADDLPSLKKKHANDVDLQFLSIQLDSVLNKEERLASLITQLDQASQMKSDISQPRNQRSLFSSRREHLVTIPGLNGVSSINGCTDLLRIAGKNGARFMIWDGVDGKWITEEGLSAEGKKAVKVMNKNKMALILLNMSEDDMSQILDVSQHPVIVANIVDETKLSDDFFNKVSDSGSLFYLRLNPTTNTADLAQRIELLSNEIDWEHLGLFPVCSGDCASTGGNSIWKLTVALKNRGVEAVHIQGILGNNLDGFHERMNQ